LKLDGALIDAVRENRVGPAALSVEDLSE